MRAHTRSNLLPIEDVIRDLQLPANVVSCDDIVEVFRRDERKCEETKLDVEEAIALGGAA
jgi:hypothetical protein